MEQITLEQLVNAQVTNPINEFTGFKGSFPIEDPNAENRNNAKLMVWEGDGIFHVIPSKVDGNEYSINEATRMAVIEGSASYPQFRTLKEALVWAKAMDNKVNEDGTIAD